MRLSGLTPVPREAAGRYRELGYWRDQPLGQVFHRLFTEQGDREAMVYAGRRTTYAQLDERVERLAKHLVSLGYRQSDVVVMQLPNGDDFVYLYFALLRVGAVPLMALAAHREHEIGHYLEFTEAKGYAIAERVGRFDGLTFALGLRDKAPTVKHVFVSGDTRGSDRCLSIGALLDMEPPVDVELDALEIDPDMPAVFQLSGGTTGIPKIIPRTHNDYDYNSRSVSEWCGMDTSTVLLVAAPIAHNLPLATPGLMGTFYAGGRIVISPTPRPQDTLPLIAEERVTQVEGTPAMYIAWIDHELAGRLDLSSVLAMRSGGQRCQPELKRRIEGVFGSAKVTEGFGMGEGLIMWTRLDDPDDIRLNTVGRPWCPDDEIRVVDEEYRDVPDGVTGQLLVRGPYTLRGYYDVPEANAKAFTPDGFLCTGDLVTRLPNGYFTVDGRIKDLVNRGGEKISTEEIENILLAMPGVSNAACIAVADESMGERMCACLVLAGGAGPVALQQVNAHLTERGLARFKFPEYLLTFDEFPVSPFGKVSKKALSALAAERLANGDHSPEPALASHPKD